MTFIYESEPIYFFTSASCEILTRALSLFAKLPILIPSQSSKRGILVTIIIDFTNIMQNAKRRAPTLRTKYEVIQNEPCEGQILPLLLMALRSTINDCIWEWSIVHANCWMVFHIKYTWIWNAVHSSQL